MADNLILMEKDGEQIRVHPLALEDHKRLGWKVVPSPDESVAVETTAEDAKPKAGKSKAKE